MLRNRNLLIVVLLILEIIHMRVYLLIKYKLACTVCRQKFIIIFVVLLAEVLTKLRQLFVRIFAEIRADDVLVEAKHVVVEVIGSLKRAPGSSIEHGAVDHVTSFNTLFPQVQGDYLSSQTATIDVQSCLASLLALLRLFLVPFLHIGLVNVVDYGFGILPCSAVGYLS